MTEYVYHTILHGFNHKVSRELAAFFVYFIILGLGHGGQGVGVQTLGQRHRGWQRWGSWSGGRGRDWLHGDDGVPALLPSAD